MVQNGYFSHESPSGLTPWFWLDKVGYDYEYAGENLAVNFTNSEDVSNAWMNSPLHRANILSENYKEIGMAMHDGVYENKDTIFVVQMFGSQVEKEIVPDTSVITSNTETTPSSVKKIIPKAPPVKILPTSSEAVETVASTSSEQSTTTTTNINNEEVKGEAVSNIQPQEGYSTAAERTII